MAAISYEGIGALLPVLQTLILNGSAFTSFRGLGTGLRQLRTLSLAGCGGTRLDGIRALSALRELNLQHNAVDDVSALPCTTRYKCWICETMRLQKWPAL
jgi:Leucine-rich repeat (LRR) protein